MPDNELIREGKHMMSICNSCRYCEGYCAVWPAMEYRREFPAGDLNYLANLCHECGDCYYACQYAPPHEFLVNPPKTFARLRAQSYEDYAWPGPIARAVRKKGILFSLCLAIVMMLVFYAVGSMGGKSLSNPVAGADFYQIISHNILALSFGAVALYVLMVLVIGVMRFWRDIGEKPADLVNPSALMLAVKEALRLEYLDGSGWGCAYPAEQTSQARRWFHHVTFYGFMLCLASTAVAAVYDYILHLPVPYDYISVPVVLGTLGGIGLLIGPIGLLVLKTRRNRDISDEESYGRDVSFVLMLMLTSLTGLLLVALRETPFMGRLLVVHLGFVMTLFLLLPYGKFVHGIYRFAALVKYALERKRKRALGV